MYNLAFQIPWCVCVLQWYFKRDVLDKKLEEESKENNRNACHSVVECHSPHGVSLSPIVRRRERWIKRVANPNRA
jgi:hypothetical protein